MWNDVEAKVDLLNFSLVAEAAAELIRESGGAPITIGVSGGWGVGKSSLVKMVGRTLEIDREFARRYSNRMPKLQGGSIHPFVFPWE